MRRTRWVGALVVAALAVGGCLGGSVTPSPASPQPGSSASIAGPPLDLVELTTRIRAADGTTGRFVRDLGAALSQGPVAISAAGNAMAAWADAETAWLDDHPAEPCWQAARTAYLDAVGQIAQAGTAFIDPELSDEAGHAAATTLAAGRTAIAGASNLATAAVRACGG